MIAVNTEERDQSQILLVQSEHGLAITQRLLALLGETRVGKWSPASRRWRTPTST